MKKVLHLVSAYTISGVTRNLSLVALRLRERGWEPRVYHYGPGTDLGQPRGENGLVVSSIPRCPGLSRRFRARWVIGCLKYLLVTTQPDLVHAHSFDADLVALRAAAGTRIPVLITCQSFSYLDWAKRYLDHYRKWAHRIHAVVSVTEAMSQALRQLPPFAAVPHDIIYNAAAERFFSGPDAAARGSARRQLGVRPEEVLITCTATFHPIKGHIVLADAFARLASTHPNARMILIGDTLGKPDFLDIRAEVEAVLSRSPCAGRYRILQDCRDAEPVLCATDIYVQPSFMEALSVATAEAMAMGIPVVASNVGGLQEMICENRSGLRVEPGDARSLAHALTRLIDSPDLRRRMGAHAARYARLNFSPDAAAERYESVYARALHA